MQIPTQSKTNDPLPIKDDDNNKTDIVPFTVKLSMESKTVYDKCLHYPKDYIFYFEVYDNVLGLSYTLFVIKIIPILFLRK